jgi:hypothetical protein
MQRPEPENKRAATLPVAAMLKDLANMFSSRRYVTRLFNTYQD